MRALVWFRSDLRVGDNAVLARASREATRGVVGVFCRCPGQWAAHGMSPRRAGMILASLRALAEDLAFLNIALRVVEAERFTDVGGALLALARELGCDALFFHRELEVNESRRDTEVSRAFEAAGIRVRAFDDACILAPGSVATAEGRAYTVFTPFRRRIVSMLVERGLPELERAPKRQASMVCASDKLPAVWEHAVSVDPGVWAVGERAARSRLDEFLVARVGAYASARDLPGVDGTSRLSPSLAAGTISVRESLMRATEADGRWLRAPARGATASRASPTGVGAWVSELFWREFYRHLLAAFPCLCMGAAMRREFEGVAWSTREDHFEAWRIGRTGVPIVDAAMRELATTGWTHNRCRMIVASYLTKNLLIDWRRGEHHFMSILIDGDLAANNGGWQWAASTGADAAPYFRVFNPVSQSLRFDPDGAYIKRHVPELRGLEGEALHQPWALPDLVRSRLDYPEPLVDLAASRARAIEAYRAARESVNRRV